VFSYPDLSCWLIGETVADRLKITLSEEVNSETSKVVLNCSLAELKRPWASALEDALHDEVTA
jgi:hypothetical protein